MFKLDVRYRTSATSVGHLKQKNLTLVTQSSNAARCLDLGAALTNFSILAVSAGRAIERPICRQTETHSPPQPRSVAVLQA